MKAARWGKGLTCPVKYGIINSVTYGEMSERFKELVLKTSDPKRAVGSNPTLSARYLLIWLSFTVTRFGDVPKLVKGLPC